MENILRVSFLSDYEVSSQYDTMTHIITFKNKLYCNYFEGSRETGILILSKVGIKKYIIISPDFSNLKNRSRISLHDHSRISVSEIHLNTP